MKDQVKKFLEFNGKTIFFVKNDGQYLVAIKPICEALDVDYRTQALKMKNDELLSQLCRDAYIVAADGKQRKMTCLPERYVYGWIFGIQSPSKKLLEYKRECYDVLFDYFNGSITRRKMVLNDKTLLRNQIEELEEKLAENEDHQKWLEMKQQERKINKSLRQMDDDLLSQQTEIDFSF